jgi:hypothetical protein
VPRPILHNLNLPNWLHRLANGAIGGLLALAALHFFGFPFWLLWIAISVAVGCMVPSPSRFTLVEGCAGDVGYDELDSD